MIETLVDIQPSGKTPDSFTLTLKLCPGSNSGTAGPLIEAKVMPNRPLIAMFCVPDRFTLPVLVIV